MFQWKLTGISLEIDRYLIYISGLSCNLYLVSVDSASVDVSVEINRF